MWTVNINNNKKKKKKNKKKNKKNKKNKNKNKNKNKKNYFGVAHPQSGSSSTRFLIELEFGKVGF